MLMLELNLLPTDSGVLVLVIVEIYHTVANNFVAAEPGELVVAGDDVRVVTDRLSAERRL